MTDQQTWEQACERAGVWDGLEQCRRWDEAHNPLEPCPHGYYRDHNRTCPPIGDPAACMVILEYLVKQPLFLARVQGMFVEAVRGNQTVPLAVAAAVCALKEES